MESLLKDDFLTSYLAPKERVYSEKLLDGLNIAGIAFAILGIATEIIWFTVILGASYAIHRYNPDRYLDWPKFLSAAALVALLALGAYLLGTLAKKKCRRLYEEVPQGKIVKVIREDDGTSTYKWKLVLRGKNRMNGLRTQEHEDETDKSAGDVYVINGYADFS